MRKRNSSNQSSIKRIKRNNEYGDISADSRGEQEDRFRTNSLCRLVNRKARDISSLKANLPNIYGQQKMINSYSRDRNGSLSNRKQIVSIPNQMEVINDTVYLKGANENNTYYEENLYSV